MDYSAKAYSSGRIIMSESVVLSDSELAVAVLALDALIDEGKEIESGKTYTPVPYMGAAQNLRGRLESIIRQPDE
jgi:hypothetical protein